MDKAFAAAKAGGQHMLAKLLGVSRSAVCQWGPQMPWARVLQLQKLRPKWFAEWRRQQGGGK